MNNLQDQRDWAPPQYNQYQQWAEIHPTDPQFVSDVLLKEGPLGEEYSYSWRNQLGLWRGATNNSCGASNAPGKDPFRNPVLKRRY